MASSIGLVFQQIDKVFNNIGADLLSGSESENREDGMQGKQKRVSFSTYKKISSVRLPVNHRESLGNAVHPPGRSSL
jgi:hypothetical protein